ncbi:ABC transporter permease [Dictyobacter aurantiacus]|uniref:Protein lplB n=1 Tax=Dictyobacter aurantiacus TaxID=1936993 RepID=A0A401ZGF8_9CHLR|nr:ABC transporter permease subunit [Dictyobacter aurantiacus]GCE05974.1 protein lplB [Dictyobacter aurantiacus]
MGIKTLAAPSVRVTRSKSRSNSLFRRMWRYRYVYLMLLPGLLYFAIFRYGPLYEAQIAFKDFQPLLGVEGSPWIGFKNFEVFFKSYYFTQLLTNTLVISVAKLIFGIPPAIILALALSEIRYFPRLARITQTMSYLPHFLSWIVIFGILLGLFSPSTGLVNSAIGNMGGQPVSFLTDPNWFRAIVVSSDIWKETGWGAILYLAALLAVDPAQYEAASIDGASRLQRIINISLPNIKDVIVLVTLLRLGSILDAGFTQIFAMYSLPVYSVGDIIDTWVYREGILNAQFSLATAVGLFKGLIGLCLIVVANRVAKRFAGTGLY